MNLETASEDRIRCAPDRDEIVRVVRLYTDGVGARDPAMFAEAFHPSARMYFTTADGELHEGLIADNFEEWASWNIHVRCRMLAVMQAGEVATVVLGFDADSSPADCWVDVHCLLRIDGRWKIINKTATHASRAGWAASSIGAEPFT